MPLIDTPIGDLKLEKSIVIDSRTAKQYEAQGITLPSDEFVERDRGENLAPAQFVQEVVDANTAARLAYQQGITLAPSVDAAAGVAFANEPAVVGATGRKSKLPSAILESFQKQPPIVPQMAPAPEFDPAWVSQMQEANRRLNKVGGQIVPSAQPVAPKIPQAANQPMLTEQRIPKAPATNMYGQMQQLPQAPQYNTYPAAPIATPASVDYSLISAIVKEAVREVVKEQIREIVKDVLKEERELSSKQNINENIEIRIGSSTFTGKISSVKAPKKQG